MRTPIRRKLDMAARVREFIRAHAAAVPDYAPVLQKFEELVGQAGAIVARQFEGRVAARGARARRKELRRLLHSQLVHYLVAVGEFANENQAELAERFKLPATNANNSFFLTSVKALLETAVGQKELLIKAGMSQTLLDDLGRMVADYETVSEAQRTARRDHIGARVDLEVITTELAKQVKILDGVTRYRFGNDPEVMAEWKAAKQVLGLPRNENTPAEAPGDVKKVA